MKLALALIIIALLPGLIHAQGSSVERAFERDRKRLSVERFSVGEDATSGFYYLVYKSRREIRKIRSVWNGGCCARPQVRDLYFKDGSPVLYVTMNIEREQFAVAVKGRAAFAPYEKLYLKNSKLTAWIEKGIWIHPSEPRWKYQEELLLDDIKDQLENYRLNRKER